MKIFMRIEYVVKEDIGIWKLKNKMIRGIRKGIILEIIGIC